MFISCCPFRTQQVRYDCLLRCEASSFIKPIQLCTCIWLQALAYQWLGRWYDEIDQDYNQAQECYERAVALDDDDIIASKTMPDTPQLCV